jgi:hypothetical protein
VDALADLELLEHLGEGGFGTVLKGKWMGLVVAAKVVSDSGSDSRMVMRCAHEIAILTALSHPNIVQVGRQLCRRVARRALLFAMPSSLASWFPAMARSGVPCIGMPVCSQACFNARGAAPVREGRGVWLVAQGYRCLPDVRLEDLQELCAARLARPVVGADSGGTAGAAHADRTCHIQVTPASVPGLATALLLLGACCAARVIPGALSAGQVA